MFNTSHTATITGFKTRPSDQHTERRNEVEVTIAGPATEENWGGGIVGAVYLMVSSHPKGTKSVLPLTGDDSRATVAIIAEIEDESGKVKKRKKTIKGAVLERLELSSNGKDSTPTYKISFSFSWTDEELLYIAHHHKAGECKIILEKAQQELDL